MTGAINWYAMDEAPRDGREVILLVRHANWALEIEAQRDRWQEEVRGRWTTHNGGGWCWFGLAGKQIAWRPVTASDPVTIDG